MLHRRVQLSVRGRVQGVFFRASTERRARDLGVSGWVRNLPDGSVEVVAEGLEAALADLVRWCSVGPPGARVDSMGEEWAEPRGEPSGFRIAR